MQYDFKIVLHFLYSKIMCVPSKYLYKLTKLLRLLCIIEIIQGVNGGYKLSKTFKNITMYDMLSHAERSLNINNCLKNCSKDVFDTCLVRGIFYDINNEFNIKFKSIIV